MVFINMKEIIATAVSTIKNASTTDELLFRQWIGLLALPELGISEEDVKVTVLQPTNYTVLKPEDMRALIDVALYDTAGNQLTHKFRAGGKRIYTDTRIPATAQTDTTAEQLAIQVPVDISEDAFSFHLGTNGDRVGSIVLRYYVYPVDDSGLPLIRQDEAMAVVFFCRFMWAMRNNDSRSEIEQNRQMWMLESDRVRAKKKMYSLSPEKMKTIINSTWVRSIPSFKFRQF